MQLSCGQSSLQSLPTEILAHVISFLPRSELSTLIKINSQFRDFFSDEYLLKSFLNISSYNKNRHLSDNVTRNSASTVEHDLHKIMGKWAFQGEFYTFSIVWALCKQYNTILTDKYLLTWQYRPSHLYLLHNTV